MDTGDTPLMWTAGYGYLEVVEIQLEWCENNPDKPNNHGLKSLWCAVGNGYQGVVKVLLVFPTHGHWVV